MTETPSEYYVSKAPALLRGMDYLRKRVQDWFMALNVECRCYAIGMAFLIVAALVLCFKRPEAGILIQAGAFIFAFSLLPLFERLYELAWRTLLGKLLIAALIALATNMAYGFGRQMVAELIGTSPEPFAATVNVATILLSPVLFLMVLAIGGFFIFLIAAYVGILALMTVFPPIAPGRGRHVCLWLCRFAAFGIAVFGSWSLVNHSAGYTAWVSSRSADYLYAFDMYHDARQSKGKNEKVGTLSDGRLLVGAPCQSGGYTFVVRQVTDRPEGGR